jgi:A/G-specific adenine glycosylase
MNITETLITWYEKNKRDLPWRDTSDPYAIWLSEVILQQTRVNQGLEYYHRFIETYPSVHDLAAANEEEVLKLWQGLGYYSRARNLHHTAKTIAEQFDGQFPGDFHSLQKLKGIGEYTAAAIASIAFKEVVPVVDGNVARVISRLYAIMEPVDSITGKNLIRSIASGLISKDDPATFNQAIMEFGALQCKPVGPGCLNCPLQTSCFAYAGGKVAKIPVKLPGKPVKEVFINYLVISFFEGNDEMILIRKRSSHGIWKNLYDFPAVESEHHTNFQDLLGQEYVRKLLNGNQSEIISISQEYTHQLTHRRIRAVFSRIRLESRPVSDQGFVFTTVSSLLTYPVPVLIERYLNDAGFLNCNVMS